MISSVPGWRGYRALLPASASRLLFDEIAPGLALGILGFLLNALPVPLGFNLEFLLGSTAAFFALYMFGGVAATVAATVAGLWTLHAWGHPWGSVIFTCEMVFITVIARRGMTVIVADTAYWLCFGMPFAVAVYGIGTELDSVSVTLIALKLALNGVSNAALGYLAGMTIGWLSTGMRRFSGAVPMHALLANLLVGFAIVPAVVMLWWHANDRESMVVSEAVDRGTAVADDLKSSIENLQIEAAEGLHLIAAAIDPQYPLVTGDLESRLDRLIAFSPGILRAIDLVSLRDADGVDRALWSRAAREAGAGARPGVHRTPYGASGTTLEARPDEGAFVQVSISLAGDARTGSGAAPTLTAVFSVDRYVATLHSFVDNDVRARIGSAAIAVAADGTPWVYDIADDSAQAYIVAQPYRPALTHFTLWSQALVGVTREARLSGTTVHVTAWTPLRESVLAYRTHMRSLIGLLLGIVALAVLTAMLIGDRLARLFLDVERAIGSLPNPQMKSRATLSRGIVEIDSMLDKVSVVNTSLIGEINQVKRLERRFEHLRRFAPMAIYALERVVGGEWRIVYYGPAMHRLLGIPDGETHRAELFLQRVHPRHRTAVLAAWRRFLRTGAIRHEYRVCGADGKYRWVYNELSRIDEESIGGNEYAIGAIADITQRKDNAMRLKTSAKLITLGEMATGMAHELNQPLNVIRLAAENMLAQLDRAGLPESLRVYLTEKLERIGGQTQRAAQIIDHMRIFGRRPADQPIAFDVNEAIDGALTMTAAQLRVAGLTVVTRLADDLPPVIGHQQMLEQVVINLVLNARDALQEKLAALPAVEVGPAYAGRIVMDTAFDRPAGRVVLRIADNGPGIPQEVGNRIFEPFFTTKPVGKGTGLGLSVSYGIVVEMGGTIEVASSRDGTVFTIGLPPKRARASGVPSSAGELPSDV